MDGQASRKTYGPEVTIARAELKAAIAAGQWPGGKNTKITADLIEGLDDFDLLDLYHRLCDRREGPGAEK